MTDKRIDDLRRIAEQTAQAAYMSRAEVQKRIENAARLAGFHSDATIDAFKSGVYFGRMGLLADMAVIIDKITDHTLTNVRPDKT